MHVIKTGTTYTIIPEVQKRTLIWIHGLGDTGEAFCNDFFEAPLISDCKVILPTAPINPVTIYQGEMMTSWYDIKGDYGYDPSIEASVETISEILREEEKHTDCLMIGGFSQGAVTSLYAGLCKYEGIVQAIIALSGYVLPMNISPERFSIPVLMYHGTQDERIPLKIAEESARNYLTGTTLTFEVNQAIAHEVTFGEYEYIRKWLSINII